LQASSGGIALIAWLVAKVGSVFTLMAIQRG